MRGCLLICLLIAAFCVLMCALGVKLPTTQTPDEVRTELNSSAEQREKIVPKDAKRYVVPDNTVAFSTLDDYRLHSRLMNAPSVDAAAIQKMHDAGLVVVIQARTDVIVNQKETVDSESLSQITVASGPDFGKKVWLFSDLLEEKSKP